MIGIVPPVSYSRAVFEVQPVAPVRGRGEIDFSTKEENKEVESFLTHNKPKSLLDILI